MDRNYAPEPRPSRAVCTNRGHHPDQCTHRPVRPPSGAGPPAHVQQSPHTVAHPTRPALVTEPTARYDHRLRAVNGTFVTDEVG
ncbi:MAG: hypothetical protein JWP82_1467 [Humibacillus sp.]|nr:hypothetical protein [Humibacillus sp.]